MLDSFGTGKKPGAADFVDFGFSTLATIALSPKFHRPNLQKMELFHLDRSKEDGPQPTSIGVLGQLLERSMEKDTAISHWEITGVESATPPPVYPDGFSPEVMEKFQSLTGRKAIYNKPYSSTELLKDYGKEHLRTRTLIGYMSADSLFQIAATRRSCRQRNYMAITALRAASLRKNMGWDGSSPCPSWGTAYRILLVPHGAMAFRWSRHSKPCLLLFPALART